ncbi:MAG: AgmX/PglI C-terminal domain-containing protein [Myxococcales bacterium]|nr:AgmX/PglI C-terminal domain-containing protein [Myxococcales bacterium]
MALEGREGGLGLLVLAGAEEIVALVEELVLALGLGPAAGRVGAAGQQPQLEQAHLRGLVGLAGEIEIVVLPVRPLGALAAGRARPQPDLLGLQHEGLVRRVVEVERLALAEGVARRLGRLVGRAGQPLPLAVALGVPLDLDLDVLARVVGDPEVALRERLDRGAVVAGRGEVDWPFWAYFGGTATLGVAFYMLMRAMPDDALSMQLADEEAAAHYARFLNQADEQKQEEPAPDEQVAEAKESAGGQTGKRAAGPEGQMGNKTAKTSGKAYAMSGKGVPQMARTFDPDRAARNAGILGLIASQEGHFLASADGGAFAVGTDDQDVWGNLVGTEIGESYGTGGLGLVGTGHSGGGTAQGLLGLGTTGLIGHGTGTGGHGFGPDGGGSSSIGFGPKKKPTITATAGKGEVVGDIDKDTIRRIVRSHLMEVRGCYNAGLSKDPHLEGRVMIQFSIIGTGAVGSAVVQENTTGDNDVGNCIAKAVKRWKFPRTRSGGTAMVTYPFRLSAR